MKSTITDQEFNAMWEHCEGIHKAIENPAPRSINYPQNGTSIKLMSVIKKANESNSTLLSFEDVDRINSHELL